MSRMSLSEAVQVLNTLNYTVGKTTGGYIVRSQTGQLPLMTGFDVVRMAREKQASFPILSDSGEVNLEEVLSEAYIMVVDAGVRPAPRENISVGVYGAKRSWGWCSRTGNKYRIRISEMCIETGRESVKETMIHEILHTVSGCMNHGPQWKEEANKVNKKYGLSIKRTSSREEKSAASGILVEETYNYRIVCQTCGKEYLRHRRSNLTERTDRYRCACGGKLKLD